MPKTENEIIELIKKARPDYSNVIDLVIDADYAIFEKIIQSDNIRLSSKAVNGLGALKNEKSLLGLEAAAKSHDPNLRVAAAFALRYFTNFPAAVSLINDLLDDPDLGVRKFALKTADFAKLVTLKEKVRQVFEKETSQRMKVLSTKVKETLDNFDNSNIIIQ